MIIVFRKFVRNLTTIVITHTIGAVSGDPHGVSYTRYAVDQLLSFAAVLHLLLCFIFAPYERKNETQKMESTMLPQAIRCLFTAPHKS